MPIIDVMLSEGQFSSQQKAALAEQLTQCLLSCDATRDIPKAKIINWCYIHELPKPQIFVGGVNESQSHFRIEIKDRIEIKVMQGTMSAAVKQQVVADMTRVMLEMEGQKVNALNASRVWVLIQELPEGHWGVAGQIYGLDDLMQYLDR